MRILSLVLVVCLMVVGATYSMADDSDLYDSTYGPTYSDLYDEPFYSATYAVEPDTDWIPVRQYGPVPAALVLSLSK